MTRISDIYKPDHMPLHQTSLFLQYAPKALVADAVEFCYDVVMSHIWAFTIEVETNLHCICKSK